MHAEVCLYIEISLFWYRITVSKSFRVSFTDDNNNDDNLFSGIELRCPNVVQGNFYRLYDK